eukprot:CAMPEP_0172541514 /NCGR_PEP_ID=MMETSP1067-20121228/12311_1 /TAXON_ID=265564 ORGANISM="Thalassiosira punctigera, Strain Tpunct2005C2" /NCGR_SAMPLE_ID=MMETSP1067 /ASSEMBLY_ACC=CAM_ASM_000444 /LENGTH=157 /DNA_ID=CAMNT_0013327573 /DNA_START=82 /DNA_END=556 /DNA_ORIENTATION=+
MLPTSSLRSFLPRRAARDWHRILSSSSPQAAADASPPVRSFSEDSSRLHSTDIAFKPAESGWGGGGKYSDNFDAVFGKKEGTKTSSEGGIAKEEGADRRDVDHDARLHEEITMRKGQNGAAGGNMNRFQQFMFGLRRKKKMGGHLGNDTAMYVAPIL